MTSCRRLTRRDRARNAAILNGIVDLPANHHDAHILAYGRPSYRLREVKNPIPGHVAAWCNSPAARETEMDRLLRRVEPGLLAVMLAVGAVYVTLAWIE
jgi:hypothetical protein